MYFLSFLAAIGYQQQKTRRFPLYGELKNMKLANTLYYKRQKIFTIIRKDKEDFKFNIILKYKEQCYRLLVDARVLESQTSLCTFFRCAS